MTNSDYNEVIESIKRTICSKTTLESRGVDCYLVHTGFTFQDGDELHILLKKTNDRWILTDEAHTLMWLSYEDFTLTESRKGLLNKTLRSNNATMEEGRIIIDCTNRDAGQCLMYMIQAILQTADLLYLNRNNVRNSYNDDVKQMMRKLLGDRCEFDKHINNNGEDYLIDIYVEAKTPLYVFTISNKDHCKDAIISLMALGSEANLDFTSLIFIDQNAELGKDNLVKLTNRSDKTLYNTPDEELCRFLNRIDLHPIGT